MQSFEIERKALFVFNCPAGSFESAMEAKTSKDLRASSQWSTYTQSSSSSSMPNASKREPYKPSIIPRLRISKEASERLQNNLHAIYIDNCMVNVPVENLRAAYHPVTVYITLGSMLPLGELWSQISSCSCQSNSTCCRDHTGGTHLHG